MEINQNMSFESFNVKNEDYNKDNLRNSQQLEYLIQQQVIALLIDSIRYLCLH